MIASPLSSATSPAAGAELASALAHGNALHALLEQEFEALRAQELDRFEALQPEKLNIFEALGLLVERGQDDAVFDRPEWMDFRELIADCRDLHRRNEILISRKLDAIRGTLHTLRGSDPTAPVEVYDRLGRMSRMRGGRGYEEA
jgi:flagellar biosynthesis/type III secretory pathway chaperone